MVGHERERHDRKSARQNVGADVKVGAGVLFVVCQRKKTKTIEHHALSRTAYWSSMNATDPQQAACMHSEPDESRITAHKSVLRLTSRIVEDDPGVSSNSTLHRKLVGRQSECQHGIQCRYRCSCKPITQQQPSKDVHSCNTRRGRRRRRQWIGWRRQAISHW